MCFVLEVFMNFSRFKEKLNSDSTKEIDSQKVAAYIQLGLILILASHIFRKNVDEVSKDYKKYLKAKRKELKKFKKKFK